MKKKILLFADWYEPGYKAGGPIRSCVNFARHMQEEYRVFVFTSDRDLGSVEPYAGIRADHWQEIGENLSIYYCSPRMLSRRNIRGQLEDLRPDFVYLNSMFSPKFTIYPLLIGRLYARKLPVILSPRGMLRESAIRFKTRKKKFFLSALRMLGAGEGIRFHATDETEGADIARYFGKRARVAVIPNFPGVVAADLPVPEKKKGELSMIFVGRVHPIKNLHFLLEILREVVTRVRLTIVGSLEDSGYWEKCKRLIALLPEQVKVVYVGELAHAELPAITAKQHIFVLPTSGENFGHAIFEALALGKPVLISDQTPWRGLRSAGAGWDLALDTPFLFREAIEEAGGFGQEEYESRVRSTQKYLQDYIAGLNLKEAYQKLFS